MISIYRITNKINGKTYIGQHTCKTLLRDDEYMGSGKIIKQAITKYGIENFSKEIITIAIDRLEADTLEKFYIAKERSIGKAEYNIADGGGGTSGVKNKYLSERNRYYTWNKGKRNCYSEETIEKMSNSKKGTIPWNKGKKTGQETWMKGKHHSEESKQKNRMAHLGRRWYNNGKKEVLAKECPKDYKLGRLTR